MRAPTDHAGRTQIGLLLAVASAVSFGLSGTMAAGLYGIGWTAGSAVLTRIALAALVLAWPGLRAVGGRPELLTRNWRTILAYGVFAVTGSQLCYFYAVSRLPVSVALLIEYTAPVAVVAWTWVARGDRPSLLTAAGAVIAAAGLVLLLDLFGTGGGQGALDTVGVLWALGAMVGAAVYFVMSANVSSGLPAITLAASGLVVGTVLLGALALLGVVPVSASTRRVDFEPFTVPWWIPVAALGLVTAALAYVTGIEAGRRLGPRLTSFVALSEVVAATVFAWWLLDQVPTAVQFVGAVILLSGVAVVRLGEPNRAEPNRADRAT